MSRIGSASEFKVCVFRKRICRGAQTKFPNYQCYEFCVSCAWEHHCTIVLMAFLACASPPHKVAIQVLPGHHTGMSVGACGGVLFPLSTACARFRPRFHDSRLG